MKIQECIERDGFVVQPGLLSTDEVTQLRTAAIAAIQRQGFALGNGWAIPNAAVVVPEIRWLVHHDGLLTAVREALGTTKPVFTLEADIHQNFVAGKWHKDTGEKVMPGGYFDCDPIGRDDCRVVKVALYLQDHHRGGGLNVRPASHKTASIDTGEQQPVLTRAGDAILFDVRITHRGRTANTTDKLAWGVCQLAPKSKRAQSIARLRQRALDVSKAPARVAVYIAYGIPTERTTRFALRNLKRQQSQTGAHDLGAEKELIDELQSFGLETVSSAMS